ncbi:hypothetical protein ACHAXT_010462 [Thalassiosira profunda]
MLLQQRASTITFPNVWTNACCSHPLHGMQPSEVDAPAAVADGTVMGVKRAAVRKLEQELGIPWGRLIWGVQVPDAAALLGGRHGHPWQAEPVGEHEIDYVLFATVPDKSVLTIKPHPDEVDAVKWVTQQQLLEMFDDKNLLFSPWFRLITNKWMIGSNDKKGRGRVVGRFGEDHDDRRPLRLRNDPHPIRPRSTWGGERRAHVRENEIVGDASKSRSVRRVDPQGVKLSQLLPRRRGVVGLTLLYLQPLKSNLASDAIASTFDAGDLAFCDEILCQVSGRSRP